MTDMTIADLRRASDLFYEALAVVLAGEADPMLELLSSADDSSYLGPMGGAIIGWDAIRKAWEDQADSELGGRVSPSDRHYVVGEDIGIVVGWEKGEGHRGMPDEINIRATSTYRLEDGVVKMIGHHTDRLPG
ncbi:MAG: nuclear transport factor 2 family protein [Actinobacteria bacterium]|nr:nuclear transport factor 2 family protein [Actinomycetota bacterium]